MIHYSVTAGLSQVISFGYGVCCEHGKVTGYGGLVTCPECKAVYEAAKAEIRAILNSQETMS